jgi:hypothetical protein
MGSSSGEEVGTGVWPDVRMLIDVASFCWARCSGVILRARAEVSIRILVTATKDKSSAGRPSLEIKAATRLATWSLYIYREGAVEWQIS